MKLRSASPTIVSPRSASTKSQVFARFDTSRETFVYTQDGVDRQVQLKSPITRGLSVGLTCAAASLLPLTAIASQVATPLVGSATGIALAAVLGGTAGLWTYSAAKVENSASIAEANEHGFCEKYQRFSETHMDRDIDQTALESKLVSSLDPQLVKLHYSEDISRLDGKLPTTSELRSEFKKLSERQDIPYQYIIDGCYSRAHLMCEEMTKDGLNNAKIFVSIKNENQPEQALVTKNSVMEASWNWHVAPLVLAKDDQNSKPEPYVMDPSMSDHPMKPEEWINAMWDHKDELLVDVTRREQYFPGGQTATFADSIGDSHRTMHDYTAKLECMKEKVEPAKLGFWGKMVSSAHAVLEHAS